MYTYVALMYGQNKHISLIISVINKIELSKYVNYLREKSVE